MKFKITISLLVIFLVQMISSCCKGFKYYDFSMMSTYVFYDGELATDSIPIGFDSVTIGLYADDLNYVASFYVDLGFVEATAFQCAEGWGGMKYKLTDFQITSDFNFHADYPAKTSLNNLFQVSVYNATTNAISFVPLNEVDFEEFFTTEPVGIELLLPEKPTESKTHQFNIKLVKSNGEEILVQTDSISWN